jgi:hypothetical protein
MAKKSVGKTAKKRPIETYEHEDKTRVNNPPVGLVTPDTDIDTSKKTLNKNLHKAKNDKKDEFYTQLSDIEKEMKHYKGFFKGKVVLCNCDDPWVSNFFRYFANNFEKLRLKKLITTCYKNQNMALFSQNKSEKAIYLEYQGDKNANNMPDPEEIGIKHLKGDGDFRSEECIELLKKQADIVVTNPPFSLFREYVAQLIRYDKKFVIIGHQNAITYNEIFRLIKDNKIWLGYGFTGGATHFITHYEDHATAGNHKEGMVRVSGVHWFTNLDINKRHEDLILYKKYNPGEYPTYDNYDAINVDKTKDIPMDYDGVMGVPITFLDKYNPEQFEILGITDRQNTSGLRSKKYTIEDVPNFNDLNARSVIKTGNTYKAMYARLLIKKKLK